MRITAPFNGQMNLTPKPAFLQQVIHSMTQAIQTNKLEYGLARPMRGKLLHLSDCMSGKVDRGQTFAPEMPLQSAPAEAPPELRTCIQFFLAVFKLEAWRSVNVALHARQPLTIGTDAAASPGEQMQHVTVCYVVHSSISKHGGYRTTPVEILGSFEDKQTYIAHSEAFAILFLLWHEAAVLHFIDSLGKLSAFCKGISRSRNRPYRQCSFDHGGQTPTAQLIRTR